MKSVKIMIFARQNSCFFSLFIEKVKLFFLLLEHH